MFDIDAALMQVIETEGPDLHHHVQEERVAMEDAMKAATHPHDFKLLVSSDGQRSTSVDSVFAA
jgi:twitching motility protein PilT